MSCPVSFSFSKIAPKLRHTLALLRHFVNVKLRYRCRFRCRLTLLHQTDRTGYCVPPSAKRRRAGFGLPPHPKDTKTRLGGVSPLAVIARTDVGMDGKNTAEARAIECTTNATRVQLKSSCVKRYSLFTWMDLYYPRHTFLPHNGAFRQRPPRREQQNAGDSPRWHGMSVSPRRRGRRHLLECAQRVGVFPCRSVD